MRDTMGFQNSTGLGYSVAGAVWRSHRELRFAAASLHEAAEAARLIVVVFLDICSIKARVRKPEGCHRTILQARPS